MYVALLSTALRDPNLRDCASSSDGAVLIAYGARGNALLHVSEVSRGYACDCVCAQCNRPLIARKGRKRREHFAHVGTTTCDGGLETVLHRLAKELFFDIRVMTVPEYVFHREQSLDNGESASHTALVVPSEAIQIGSVHVEKPVGGLIPDITITHDQQEFFIEIAVTHRVDAEKLCSLRALNRPVLEIRLSPEDALLSREQLRAKLTDDTTSKHWLYHPHQVVHEEQFKVKLGIAVERAKQARYARIRFSAKTFARARRSRTARPATEARTENNWRETEHFANECFRKTGRFPTYEESKVFHSRHRKR
jgi:hypothetical protein